MKESFDNLNWW